MKFSFVILLDNNKKDDFMARLRETNILEKTQFILVGSEENKKNYPSYTYIVDDLTNYSRAFNKAIPHIDGDYINFSFASSYMKKVSYQKLLDVLKEKRNERIFNFEVFTGPRNRRILNPCGIDSEHLSTMARYNKFNLVIDSFFLSKIMVKEKMFDESLGNFGPADYLIKTLDDEKHYYHFYNDYLYYKETTITDPKCKENIEKSWYQDFIENYVLKLLKERDSYFIKIVSYYLILIRFCANENTNNKKVLNEKELKNFLDLVEKCLEYIPEEVIWSLNLDDIPKYYNEIMVSIKNKNYYKDLKKKHLILNRAERQNIVVDAVNNHQNYLQFDCRYNGLNYLDKDIRIIVKIDNKNVETFENKIYSSTSFFGKFYTRKYTFHFNVKKDDIKDKSALTFYITDGKDEVPLIVTFNPGRPQSRLTDNFENAYWQYDKGQVMTRSIYAVNFQKMNYFKRVRRELKLYKDFLNNSVKKNYGYSAIGLRILYYITRPFYKHKRIWITSDKLYKAGDNGEYFYQYCKTRKEDKVRCYYIISKGAYDYKHRLCKDKNILKFCSLKNYLTVLNSEAVFATHSNATNYVAFNKGKEQYFRDLMNFDIFHLQHGLCVDDFSHSVNRVIANVKLMFCCSKVEMHNLNEDKYDYHEYNAVKGTGAARFDGLRSNDQKQILITPTWRKSVSVPNNHLGKTRPYNKDFKNSTYFKVFNSLITDKKLIEGAKKYGYKIIYLVHPTLTAQAKDFKGNEVVQVCTTTEEQSYEKLLTESSLMVTDYSGVMYDFAYMRKPLIYYHPDELPPHYEEDGMDYEKEGFGPVIKKCDKLVDELINSMKNNCKNDKKYIERANSFFLHDDYNNCQRIYDEVIKYFKEKE